MLPDVGPTDGPIPEEAGSSNDFLCQRGTKTHCCQTDCVVIGAGIAGVTSARAMVEAGRPGVLLAACGTTENGAFGSDRYRKVLILDRYETLGGCLEPK